MAKIIGTLKRIGEQICQSDFLGFSPTSNSTKPPHIANGVFRECIGETSDTNDFHKWIIDEQKKGGVSTKQIIQDYKEILAKGDKTNETKTRLFRNLLNDLFNPDNTAYASEEFSSYNISSHYLIKKRISAEGGIGEFIYSILASPLNNEVSPMLEIIRKSIKQSSDNLTKLIMPIIVYPTKDDKLNKFSTETYNIVWDEITTIIRNGFNNLAQNIKKIGEDANPLLVQERVVCYSCFSTFLYLANSNAAKYNGNRVPIFIDAGTNSESIKKASEQSFTLAKTSVEDYYINAIRQILLADGVTNTLSSCKRYLDDMQYSSTTEGDKVESRLKTLFDSFCKDADPIYALSHALQLSLYTFEYKNNSPSDFCRVLGVRCGLVGPKGNRAKIKRYQINSFLLETLTLCVLSQDDLLYGIEMKEVGTKFAKTFGILFGYNDDMEYPILESNNITKSTPGDLRGDMASNAQKISDIFISLGLGHRYADGVTILKWSI